MTSLFELIAENHQVPGVSDFRANIINLCTALDDKIELAQKSQRRESRQRTIRRLIREFERDRPMAFSVKDLGRLLTRLQREADTGLANDEVLAANIAKLKNILMTEEAKGVRKLGRDRWIGFLRMLCENPFEQLPKNLEDTVKKNVSPNNIQLEEVENN